MMVQQKRDFLIAADSALVTALPGVPATGFAANSWDSLTQRPKVGTVLRRHLVGDPDQVYFLYVPRSGGIGAPVLVTVHGISRNAEEHAVSLAPYAERCGMVLIAPVFPRERFPDYQRLGRVGRGERADLALDAILAEVGGTIGAETSRIGLFGFSGGAQFAHRYAISRPERIAGLVLGAAGWYTFPDSNVNYPRGLRLRGELPDVAFDSTRFLAVPTCVLVGKRDIHRDAEFNTSPRVDRQQGLTRLERGRKWIEAMGDAARALGLDTPFLFDTLSRTNHSFTNAIRRGGLGERIFDCLQSFIPIRFPNAQFHGTVIDGRSAGLRADLVG